MPPKPQKKGTTSDEPTKRPTWKAKEASAKEPPRTIAPPAKEISTKHSKASAAATYQEKHKKNSRRFFHSETISERLDFEKKLRTKYQALCSSISYNFKNIHLLTEALTRQSAVEEKIDGMTERNYQRLEFVGDRVLGCVLAQHLTTEPYGTEGELTEQLKPLVSNQTYLPLIAADLHLPDYLIKGAGELVVTSKMAADAMEALLGAIYIDAGKLMPAKKLILSLWSPYFSNPSLQTRLSPAADYLSFSPTIPTRTEYNIAQLMNSLSIDDGSHFENGIYVFRKTVLSWTLEEIRHTLPQLQHTNPIANAIPETFDDWSGNSTKLNEFYEQFKDLILEDARATLSQGLELIEAKKSQPFQLRLQKIKFPKNTDNPSTITMRGRPPSSEEHGSSCLGLLLEPHFEFRSGRKCQIHLFGLGNYAEETAFISESRIYQFTIKSIVTEEIREQEKISENPIFTENSVWTAYLLGSLLSHQRMYDACKQQPNPPFAKQYISGNLSAIPQLTESVRQGIQRLIDSADALDQKTKAEEIKPEEILEKKIPLPIDDSNANSSQQYDREKILTVDSEKIETKKESPTLEGLEESKKAVSLVEKTIESFGKLLGSLFSSTKTQLPVPAQIPSPISTPSIKKVQPAAFPPPYPAPPLPARRLDLSAHCILSPLSAQHLSLLSPLNPSQQKAIHGFVSLPAGLQLLQGPPGTGKTTTIVTLLKILSELNQRVLVCAPSNKALHVLVERFLQKYPSTPIALAGVTSKVPQTMHRVLIHTWLKSVIEELNNIISNLEYIQKIFSPNEPEACSAQPETSFAILEALSEKINSLANYILFSIPTFAHYFNFNLFTTIINEKPYSSRSIYALHTAAMQLKTTLEGLNTPHRKSGENALERLLLNSAQIVFATLSVSGRKQLQELKNIDVLIIDEASQTVEAETLIPFGLNPRTCLLVGDTKQLPATVMSQEANQLNFGRSMLSRLLENCHQPHSMLTVQYRMDPKIRAFPSKQYYQNQLEDADVISTRQNIVENCPTIFAPCAFIDLNSQEEQDRHSFFNTSEANNIVQLLDYFKNQQNINLEQQVGIITFYAAQCECIDQTLKRHNYRNIMIHTVDGFQGEERDIIIISLVRANAKGSIGFLQDFRRLNVAITRARYSLLMLGNVRTLRSKKTDVADLIENLLERGLLFDEETLNKALTDPSYKTKLCQRFLESCCTFGTRCHFAHGAEELRIKPITALPTHPFSALEEKLSYHFQNTNLLRRALTRQSAIEEKLREAAEYSYQVLEFLGDRVLNLIIAKLLFQRFPEYSEAQLHEALVPLIANHGALCYIAQTLQLDQFMIKGLGETVITEKMFSDTMEALLGAVFLDTGIDLTVASIIEKFWESYVRTEPSVVIHNTDEKSAAKEKPSEMTLISSSFFAYPPQPMPLPNSVEEPKQDDASFTIPL